MKAKLLTLGLMLSVFLSCTKTVRDEEIVTSGTRKNGNAKTSAVVPETYSEFIKGCDLSYLDQLEDLVSLQRYLDPA